LPLIKRLPRKRGFTNIFKSEYEVVNISKLDIFPAGTEVTPEKLLQARLIKSLNQPIKILGDGNIQNPLLVKANKFSSIAEKKITAAGGKTERI
jgi:large subunit ribosomal protein L15